MKKRIIAIKEFAEVVIGDIGVIWFILILPLLLYSFALLAVLGDFEYNPTGLWSRMCDTVILLSSIVLGVIVYVQIIKGLIWLYLWMFW